jgi:hypothetical protein
MSACESSSHVMVALGAKATTFGKRAVGTPRWSRPTRDGTSDGTSAGGGVVNSDEGGVVNSYERGRGHM